MSHLASRDQGTKKVFIPLANRVRGPYCKLRNEFFSAKRAGHKSERKKRGSVTYSSDRENEVSKIISLGSKRSKIKRNGHC